MALQSPAIIKEQILVSFGTSLPDRKYMYFLSSCMDRMMPPNSVMSPPKILYCIFCDSHSEIFAFCTQKLSLVNRISLNAVSLSYLVTLKYGTFTCPVLSEIVNWTLYRKTGSSDQISDFWQPRMCVEVADTVRFRISELTRSYFDR